MNKELSKEEINNWSIPDENGVIHIPDELDDLFNKLGMQMRFYTISGENEIVTVARMTQIAVKYADQEKKKEAIAFAEWMGDKCDDKEENGLNPFMLRTDGRWIQSCGNSTSWTTDELYEIYNQQK